MRAEDDPRTLRNTDTGMAKATLDVCLLALIEAEESYGLQLIRNLKAEGYPLVNDRSVYPLLGRMEAEGLLQSRLLPSRDGPARRYYRISSAGRRALRDRARRSFRTFDAARRIISARVDLGSG